MLKYRPWCLLSPLNSFHYRVFHLWVKMKCSFWLERNLLWLIKREWALGSNRSWKLNENYGTLPQFLLDLSYDVCYVVHSPLLLPPAHWAPRWSIRLGFHLFSIFKVTLFRSSRETHTTLCLKINTTVSEILSLTERSQKRVFGINSLPLNSFGPCILKLPCSVYLSRRHVNNSRED